MRKNRFLALQKMAEQKKNEAMNPGGPSLNDGGPPDHNGIPKQTVGLVALATLFHDNHHPLPSLSFISEAATRVFLHHWGLLSSFKDHDFLTSHVVL